MRRMLMLAAASFALGMTGSAQAASDQDFTLVNRTGYEIDEVYVSNSASRNWGRDVLGQDVLPNGRQTDILFPAGTRGCDWDIRVVYSDRESAEWRRVNLCSISKVTLYYDRRAGTTRAVAE